MLEATHQPTSAQRYEGIQALRFLAAIMVVLVHSTFYAQERLDSTLGLYHLGANGVSLFFVISGFVLSVATQHLPAPGQWADFAIKRIIRIVPLYWLITTFKVVVLFLVPSAVLHAEFDIGYLIKSYLFLPAVNIDGKIQPFYGVGWTLNFEMMFYLLFTLAIAIHKNAAKFCAPILVALALASTLKADTWPVAARFYADNIVLNFLYGMLIASALRRNWKLPTWAAALVACAGLAVLFVIGDRVTSYGHAGLVYGLASGLTVFAFASLEAEYRKWCPGFLTYLGAASYSLYLVHPIVAPMAPTILQKLNFLSPTLSVVGSLVVSLCASIVTYKYVEGPITRLLTQMHNMKSAIESKSRVKSSV